MNPLTSIRQLWASMPASPLGPADKSAPSSASTSIPTAELRELDASGGAMSVTGAQPANSSFSNVLGQMVQDVNAKQTVASQSLQDLQSGQNVSLHQTMIAMEEASVSFQLMVEVRNRLLDSYQEIMRMQV
jgi:flagellar hook-basal body complex protein FliE